MTSLRRQTITTTAADAVARHVTDGMTIALGGFHTASRAMVLVREIIRAGRKDLTLIGSPATLDADLLIATGCVSRIILPFIGVEGLYPMGPFYRKAAEAGTIRVSEVDEGHILTMFRAARIGAEFLPSTSGLGTSLPELNPELKLFSSPLSGRPLIAVPAIKCDVALIHVARADAFGNAQHCGNAFGDPLMASASGATLVQAEEIVPNAVIQASPERTTLPAHMVNAVVQAPHGSHPFYSQGRSRADHAWIHGYMAAAKAYLQGGDEAPWRAWLDQYLYGPENHSAYLDRLGAARLAGLCEGAPEQGASR